MRLLVSVRSAGEARAALAGGADVVDAKEPARGSLGPVTGDVLREIAMAVPDGVPLSVALGDLRTVPEVKAAVAAAAAALGSREAPTFLKLGLAGVRDASSIEALLAGARDAARTGGERLAIVAVAYADHARAGMAALEPVAIAAAEAGVAGVLVDTFAKNGGDLLHWVPFERLAEWVKGVRGRGLLAAVAGSLAGDRLRQAARCGADLVGVRGAACDGGREGRLSVERVREAGGLVRADARARSRVISQRQTITCVDQGDFSRAAFRVIFGS